MKKTVKAGLAASALAATLSAPSANALIMPSNDKFETIKYCLKTYGSEGAKTVIYCDESENNAINKRPLMDNGCAEEQVAVNSTRNVTQGQEFPIQIEECAVKIDGEIEPAQL